MAMADIGSILHELDPLEKKIAKQEGESILSRWEFGRVLVKQRTGKQLPKGLRAKVREHFGLEASEITRRMELAAKFRTDAEVVDACTRCGGSWRRVIQEELRKTTRSEPSPDTWEKRTKAAVDRLLKAANGSDEKRTALVAVLQAALRELRADGADDAEAVAA